MNTRDFLEILHIAERLKDTPRHCTTSRRRVESVAEHSWRVSLMASLLKEEFPELDMDKVVHMCLIHDLVEIDAGDTYAYDAEGKKTEKIREQAAADRIFGLLPDDMVLNDDAALARAIDYRNRSLRMTLNRIGRKLGFPFPLGMHVARHTFAVKALNTTKMNVHMISRLLGHASVLVTEKVYARYLLPTLAEEVRKRITFSEFKTDFL